MNNKDIYHKLLSKATLHLCPDNRELHQCTKWQFYTYEYNSFCDRNTIVAPVRAFLYIKYNPNAKS